MCEHGWHSPADCDACTLRRVAPKAADRIADVEQQLRKWLELYTRDSAGLHISVPVYQIENLLKA